MAERLVKASTLGRETRNCKCVEFMRLYISSIIADRFNSLGIRGKLLFCVLGRVCEQLHDALVFLALIFLRL